MKFGCISLFALAALAVSACATAEDEEDDGSWATGCSDGKCDDASGAVPAFAAPDLLVTDLAVLGELERSGFSLASQLSGAGATNAALAMTSPRYVQLVETLTSDINEISVTDRSAGIGVRYAHRTFDPKWLRSAAASFVLVAVVNRTDLLREEPGTCGEVRFIYRLAYTSRQGSSRLPMTLLVSRPQRPGECSTAAQSWRGATTSATRMLSGPLANLASPDRIEINLQSVRWPAAVREDLGGHAEYLLRVFHVSAAQVSVMRLPNTISATLSAPQKTSLATWIRTNARAIDAGTARVPNEYLASKVISVSPRGLARGANRPFLAAYPRPEQTFADMDFTGLSQIKSPGGLVRMLDTMSCQGCHQTRGLAGFHVLGVDAADTSRLNALEVGTSPHVHEAMRYRRAVLDEVAARTTPATPRPFPDRDPAVAGTYGAHCGLGDTSFARWTCATGFECKDLSGEEVGMCVPEELGAGDACETSTVSLDTNARIDRVTELEVQSCELPTGRAGKCSRSKGGFPNGSCSGACAKMGATGGAAICGATPPAGFNDCIGRGDPFAKCLENAPNAFRRKCDARNSCGDDYVCGGVPGAPKGVGACMPPYFIFQARVDGHPTL